MTHRSATIECTPRETEIIRTRTEFLSIIKLGRGQEVRTKHLSARFAEVRAAVEQLSADNRKGAMLYALGSASGLAGIAVLYATYIPGSGWKFAEAADEAQ